MKNTIDEKQPNAPMADSWRRGCDSAWNDSRPVSRRVLAAVALVVSILYALLWCPYWYPLSDSALYLSLGRSLASDHGFTFMGKTHSLVQPMTPLLFAGIMKAGGGIGAIHAVLIFLMLAAHTLCFLTLRRLLNERAALLGTLAGAASYWVFLNTFTIMTEPCFLVMFWACLLVLSYAPGARGGAQWAMVLVGCALLAGAWFNRIATLFFVPGVVAALWLTTRNSASLATRNTWAIIYGSVFTGLLVHYKLNASSDMQYQVSVGIVQLDLVTILSIPGRWICESMAAPTVALFESPKTLLMITGLLGGIFVTTVCVIGLLSMIRQRRWWLVWLMIYAVPILIIWGSRCKPRYFTALVPVLFILIVAGLAVMADLLGTLLHRRLTLLTSTVAAWLVLGSVLLLNAPAYGVEAYVRRCSGADFFEVVRRGAFADLISIGDYVQRNAGPQDPVCVLDKAHAQMAQRVVFFLTGRPTKLFYASGLSEAENKVKDAGCSFAIVYPEEQPWPTWHLPLRKSGQQRPRWWQLYKRDPTTGNYQPVEVPPSDGSYLRNIPASAF